MDRLILEVAAGVRTLSAGELQRMVEQIAEAGFVDDQPQIAQGKLVGLELNGRIIQTGDRLTTAEAHYLKHVAVEQEWPTDTTFDEYLASCRAIITDPSSGIVISQFGAKGWQVAFVQPSGDLRGMKGHDWAMIEYRLGKGWITAFQFKELDVLLTHPLRRDLRWLRQLP